MTCYQTILAVRLGWHPSLFHMILNPDSSRVASPGVLKQRRLCLQALPRYWTPDIATIGPGGWPGSSFGPELKLMIKLSNLEIHPIVILYFNICWSYELSLFLDISFSLFHSLLFLTLLCRSKDTKAMT